MDFRDLEPDEFMSLDFVHRVGMITLAWAFVEYGLDYTIREIFRHHNGASIQADAPVSLKAKIAFLKKAFRKCPTLASVKDAGLDLVRDCVRLRDLRHDCVHGIRTGQQWPVVYRFSRFKYAGPNLIEEEYGYTLRDLKALGQLVANLGERLSIFSTALGSDKIDEALRELAVSKLAIPVPKKKLVLDAG